MLPSTTVAAHILRLAPDVPVGPGTVTLAANAACQRLAANASAASGRLGLIRNVSSNWCV